MSDTPDLTPEAVKRFDVVGYDWEILECGLGDYVLVDDYAALSAALAAERARAEKAEAERDALAKKLATARDDALEEAAQKVRADTFLITDHLRRIAAAIRAMKGAKP